MHLSCLPLGLSRRKVLAWLYPPPRPQPPSPLQQHIARRSLVALYATAALGCASDRASRAELHDYRLPRGSLVTAETTFTGMRGRYASYALRVWSGSGIHASGRLLRPGRGGDGSGGGSGGGGGGSGSEERRYPAVLLNDGRELDSRALDYLPGEFGDLVVLSLDYPEELPYTVSLGALLTRADTIRRAARSIPLAFSLAAAYLAGRGDVDSTRIAIAATSFAVPFAVIAAAADHRFRNVALIYGAGDLPDVLAANLTFTPAFLRRPVAWLAMRPFAELEPERYVASIAPRPIIMVNGIDDPQMPRAAVESLYAAARAPKTLIWLRTGHLMPSDTSLIRALVDTALARLPVLRPTTTP